MSYSRLCPHHRPAGLHHAGRALLLSLTLGLASLGNASAASITLNDTHQFEITAGTTITLDGAPISAAELASAGAGFNAQVNASNVTPNAGAGTANLIALRNLLKGPVTSLDPLSVLNQPITATADTVLRDVPGGDLANLALGDSLEVSGVIDANNSIVAARIRFRASGFGDWKLSGLVSGLAGSQLAIGTQLVDFTGVTPLNCVPALQDGQYVEISALADPTYTPATVLSQLTALSCLDPLLVNPPPGTVPVAVEGIISALPDPMPDPAQFTLLGAEVTTTVLTEYRGGTVDDLDLGVRVVVSGFYDALARTLLANEVRFVQAQVRFEAPLDPADVSPGQSLTIMGSPVEFTPQTRDEDGIATSGLASARQVEVRGLIDSAGQIYATRVRERGNPDLADTRLRGPVTTAAEPELLVLGITIDSTLAVFRDAANAPMTAAAFFAAVQPGTLISAEAAVYNPTTQTLQPAMLSLVDAPLPPQTEKGAGAAGVARGTISAAGTDPLFRNGFE